MNIIKITTTGSKDSQALQEQVKINELVQSPYELFEQYYTGSNYYEAVTAIGVENLEFIKSKKHNKQSLFNNLSNDTEKLLKLAKDNVDFDPNLASIQISRFMPTLTKLERHTFSLSALDKDDFELVAKQYQKDMKTNSPFSFLNIDDKNRLIHVTESIKTITKFDKDVTFDKRPRRFFSSQGSRNADRITNGLNHTTDYKHFNFNLNLQAQSLYESIHKALGKNERELGICFKFGEDENTLYFKSNLFNDAPSPEEEEARHIVDAAKSESTKKTADRRGSLSPSEIDKGVEKRTKTEKKRSVLEQFKDEYSAEEIKEYYAKSTPEETKQPEETKPKDVSDSIIIIEDDYKIASVARATVKGKMVLLNRDKNIISDSFVNLGEPRVEKVGGVNATFLIGEKRIQDIQYFGAIGFNGKELVEFKYDNEADVYNALLEKAKGFKDTPEKQKTTKKTTKEDKPSSNSVDKKKEATQTNQQTSELSALDRYFKVLNENKERAASAFQSALLKEVQDVFENREKYANEFYDLLKKGKGIDKVVDRLKERYIDEPFVFKLISNQIQQDLESTKDKDEIIKILDTDNKQLKSNIEGLEKQIIDKDERIAELSTNYEKLNIEFENKAKEFDEAITTLEESIKEKEKQFAQVLELKEEELQEVIKKAIGYKKENEELSSENKSLGEKIAKLEEKLESYENKYNTLVEESRAESKETRKIISQITTHSESLEEKIAKLEEEKMVLLKEIKKERTEKEKMRIEKEEMIREREEYGYNRS